MTTKQKQTHTPGPWDIFKTKGGYIHGIGPLIASRYDNDRPCLAVHEEDARLIAASPCLLEALKACLDFATHGQFPSMDLINEMKQAIAKAEGA